MWMDASSLYMEANMARAKCVVCGRLRKMEDVIIITPGRSLHMIGNGVVIPKGVSGYVCTGQRCAKLLTVIHVPVEFIPPAKRARRSA
jgi:hypothetical protein